MLKSIGKPYTEHIKLFALEQMS